MPTVQDLVNLLAMQDQQQGAANARMNPSTYGFGGVAPDPRAAGLAALPAAFSPAEMSQWDQQQGFHSEMAGGRPMWVAPGTPQADTGMTYAQWQRTQPTSRFGGYSIENGSPTETKVSIPLSGKAAESRDLVAGNAAAARLGVAMDAAKKKAAMETAAKARAVTAAVDPVSQRARANQTRRQTGMPMDQALARQQMLGWGDGQINPMQAEIAMPGTGGRVAIAQQQAGLQREQMASNERIAGQKNPQQTPQEVLSGLVAAHVAAGGTPGTFDMPGAQRIVNAMFDQQGQGGMQPTPVSYPGASQSPYDPYSGNTDVSAIGQVKQLEAAAKASGAVPDELAKKYQAAYDKSNVLPGAVDYFAPNTLKYRQLALKRLIDGGFDPELVVKWYDSLGPGANAWTGNPGAGTPYDPQWKWPATQ